MSRRRAHQGTPGERSACRWWIGGAGLLLAVAAVAVVSSRSTTSQQAPKIDRAAILAAELKHPAMLEVERRFVCPCGSCGDLELTECVCDGAGGAMEMKTELARLIAGGMGADDATAAVATRFGGLKPRQSWGAAAADEAEITSDKAMSASPDAASVGTVPSLAQGLVGETVDHTVAAVVSHTRAVGPQEVTAVAERFVCPCGRCSDRLADCACEHSGGAGEVKEFIRDQLSAGATVSDVTALVARRFAAVQS